MVVENKKGKWFKKGGYLWVKKGPFALTGSVRLTAALLLSSIVSCGMVSGPV
jgi:hypothetical protein